MIRLINIKKHFGDHNVLNGFTYNFDEGKITSIVAPNGSGKTTLVSVISGLLIPDDGSIEFLGNWNFDEINIVLAGEKNLYMKNTVLENLLYFGIIQGMNQKQILKAIDDYEQCIPFIKEVMNKLVETLSYGQKRLIAIFVAIITNAKCIIIDEASEGLDMKYMNIIENLLNKIAEDRAIILTSHDYNFVSKISDKILFLKDGQLYKEFDKLSLDTLQKQYMEVFDLKLED